LRHCYAVKPPSNVSFLRHMSSAACVELRETKLVPQHAAKYVQIVDEDNASILRKTATQNCSRLFSMPDTGGTLNVATQFLFFEGGQPQRSEIRAAATGNREWQQIVESTRACVQEQRSTLFVEAPLIKEHGLGIGSPLQAGDADQNVIYELRRYKLLLGYDTVPRFLEFYGQGLPSKLSAAGTHPSTSLSSLMYTEVGHLNEVIELWRHGEGFAAMEQSRQAARSAAPWREAILSIAPLAVEFTNTIHKPLRCSAWQ